MITYSVKADIRAVTRHLSDVHRRQVPFATALALNKSAMSARDRIRALMPRIFRHPKAFTVKSILAGGKGRVATKRHLTAEVWIRDEASKGTPPVKYLAPHIYGGRRNQKSHERQLFQTGKIRSRYVAPAKDFLDARGNISSSNLIKIISAVRGFTEVGYLANRSRKKPGKAKARRQRQFFVASSISSRTKHLAPGIWERIPGDKSPADPLGSNTTRVRPALVEISTPHYNKRFPFFSLAKKFSKVAFGREFPRAMQRAINNSARRPGAKWER